MQKIFLTAFALLSSIQLLMAQGLVSLYNASATYAIETNAAIDYSPGVSNPTTGTNRTATAANGFYYAVLVQPKTNSSPVPTANPFDASWTQLQTTSSAGLIGTNYTGIPGGVRGPGAISGTTVYNWGAPTANNYSDSETKWYMVVGWSSALGSNFVTALANVQNPLNLTPGDNYFSANHQWRIRRRAGAHTVCQ